MCVVGSLVSPMGLHLSFPMHPVGAVPSKLKVHTGRQVPSPAVALGRHKPGELGSSGPSQKVRNMPVGSESGSDLQLCRMHTGVGMIVTVTPPTVPPSSLLHLLMPGPPGPTQSA